MYRGAHSEGLSVGGPNAANVGHQFTGHPTLPDTRVDAFLVSPPLINLSSFNQLLFPLL
jgi:hypothetical protein